jgi:hypothetical protein
VTHLQNPFTTEFQDFLIDRSNGIDFETYQPYKEAEKRISELEIKINPLLSENGQALLLKLDTEHNYRMTAAAEVAYQTGLSEGMKLLRYLFSISKLSVFK